ncbi:MAG TPA: ABC transporter permease subunit [Candidatus Polarisedimenticolaceae bacterium]|nr:ABC transporter permease subunit [Candidatus Polarisedimenticolaceae bacterium]
MRRLRFGPVLPRRPALADVLIFAGIAALLYAGVRLAFFAPTAIAGPEISTSPGALPWYALLSVSRMAAAYALSLGFSLAYGYAAARNPGARKVLMPLLDVLQSVPILSFLPVVLLGLSAVLPQRAAAEVAAIVLIFTSQAWNLTFSFYQSLTTIPSELREAASIFRLSPWMRLRVLELPFAAIGLIWNSVMSWAGGWFFLMASEIFKVGSHDFRLPGLGSYLQTAASTGDLRAVLLGVVTLVAIVVVLDQVVWRPLLAWATKFKIESVEGEQPQTSWFRDALDGSRLAAEIRTRVIAPLGDRMDRASLAVDAKPRARREESRWPAWVAGAVLVAIVLYGAVRAASLLASLSLASWETIGAGLLATFARVAASLLIAVAWTLPVGYVIGTRPRLARVLQPAAQVLAAVPATALFPVILIVLLRLPFGLNLAAVLLMLMGTQWYLLFNVIAGASAIPRDLRDTTDLLRLTRAARWRTLVLPSLFPFVITGAITASGGAWNASIVAEFVEFGGETHQTVGVGATIAAATADANYAMLLAGTLALVGTVVLINRVFWARLYRLAEERYRME